MITKYSNKDLQIANKYDIDITRCALHTDSNNGTILLQEIDLNTENEKPVNELKKLIALKVDKKKNEIHPCDKTPVGDLDFSIHKTNGKNIISIDDYVAQNQDVLKLLFKFLETRAKDYNANQIELCTYLYKEPKFLEELGYKCYGVENNTISAWAKQDLTPYKFNTSLTDLDKFLSSNQSSCQH